MAEEKTKKEATTTEEPKTKKQAETKEETKTKPLQAEAKAEKKEISGKFKDVVEQIEKLSVLELSELVKVLEDHFGVSAAAPVAVAGAPAGGAEDGAEAAEEKSAYTVVLKASGDKKIEVIKAVREVSGLGLAESKAVVDGAPKTVKENLPKDEANEAKAKLETAGATVELE